MPRAIKLSWQPGTGNRADRWKKYYKGKMHFFPAGSGKSDMDAYDAAWLTWERKKAEFDHTTPRKHQREFERCIDRWEQVLAWCSQHGEREWAERAELKFAELRKRIAAAKLTPLGDFDWFEFVLDPFASPSAKQSADNLIRTLEQLGVIKPVVNDGNGIIYKPDRKQLDRIEGVDARVQVEVWRDRLANQQRKAVPEDQSLGGQIAMYTSRKEKPGNAGQISAGRVRATKIHLAAFQDWHGKGSPVEEIDEKVLDDFHEHLLDKVASKNWSGSTASDCMSTVKSFVRWLWSKKAIQNLPRTLDPRCKDLVIGKSTSKIQVFTKEEVGVLLAKATNRVKLYVLLMLNIGATQKDIADLLVSEVDWEKGADHQEKIQDERLRERADSELLVVARVAQVAPTRACGRLPRSSPAQCQWEPHLVGSNRPGREVRRSATTSKAAFDRLRTTTKIDKPLKSLKKSSASLLRNNKDFSGLESLFLGHAPRGMSDKHYSAVPQDLLDQAIAWLGEQFAIAIK